MAFRAILVLRHCEVLKISLLLSEKLDQINYLERNIRLLQLANFELNSPFHPSALRGELLESQNKFSGGTTTGHIMGWYIGWILKIFI